MVQQPHDKTGRKCHVCDKAFNKNSMNLSITKKEDGMIVHYITCPTCYENHMRER